MRQIKSVAGLCTLLLTSVASTAVSQDPQPSELKPGNPAPELGLTKLLQVPEGAKTDLHGLKGKVVVLEFWATWCAPCIAAMPHLNELADKFKDKPLRFIAITDENESIVAPFLKRRTLRTWVGLDTNRSTMKSYSVKFFPTTVVIDRDGKVAAITQPKKLTGSMLGDLLEGKPIATAQEKSDPAKNTARKPAQDDLKPLFAITIKPWDSEDYGWSMNSGTFKGQMTLKTALSIIHGFSETRIIGAPLLAEKRYDISAAMTEGDKDDLKPILAKAIEASFRLRVHRETREMEAFVLTAPKQGEIKLRPNASEMGHWSDAEGVMAASAAPPRALVDGIEGVLKQPVIDETGLKGRFDWDILFDAKNPDSIIDAIRKDVGLELKRARKPVEVLVVEVK